MTTIKFKQIIILSILIISLSIAYYFVIELPNHNEAQIKLETKKVYQEMLDKENKKIDQEYNAKIDKLHNETRTTLLLKCRDDVIDKSNRHLQLNGTQIPDKPGVYSAPDYIHNEIIRIQQQGFDDCNRTYGNMR